MGPQCQAFAQQGLCQSWGEKLAGTPKKMLGTPSPIQQAVFKQVLEEKPPRILPRSWVGVYSCQRREKPGHLTAPPPNTTPTEFENPSQVSSLPPACPTCPALTLLTIFGVSSCFWSSEASWAKRSWRMVRLPLQATARYAASSGCCLGDTRRRRCSPPGYCSHVSCSSAGPVKRTFYRGGSCRDSAAVPALAEHPRLPHGCSPPSQ